MNTATLLDLTYDLFSNMLKPEDTAITLDPMTDDLVEINEKFANISRAKMTGQDASDLLIEYSLVDSKAFWYYFPTLVYYAIPRKNDISIDIESFRDLITYMDKEILNPEQLLVVPKIVKLLDELIILEEKEWEEEMASWNSCGNVDKNEDPLEKANNSE